MGEETWPMGEDLLGALGHARRSSLNNLSPSNEAHAQHVSIMLQRRSCINSVKVQLQTHELSYEYDYIYIYMQI